MSMYACVQMCVCMPVHVCKWYVQMYIIIILCNTHINQNLYLLQLLMHIQCNHSDNIIESTIV